MRVIGDGFSLVVDAPLCKDLCARLQSLGPVG